MKFLAWLVSLCTVALFSAAPGAICPASGAQPIAAKSDASAGPAANAAEMRSSRADRILRFGVHVSKMGNLDPHFAAGSQDRAFADMVFNGLLRYRPGDAPNIEPDLAATLPEFTIADGRQVWTVRLKRGVFFHPGPNSDTYELTADDVVYSLRKSADGTRCAYAGEYTGMVFDRIDRYTIRIVVEEPLSPSLFFPKLTDYAGGFIVSKKAIESGGYEGFCRHPVGTGPFRFSAHRPGERLILKAHENYFRGRPQLEGVEIVFLADGRERATALTDGALDVIAASGERGWPDRVERTNEIIVDTHGVGEVSAIYLNTRLKPLDDPRVRRAVAYALDRTAFLRTTDERFVGAVYSPVPAAFLPGGLQKEEVEALGLDYAVDLERSRRLLAEAGYADGFSMDLVSSEKRLYRALYGALREQLARVGIECRVRVVPHSEMHRLIRKTPLPLVIYVAWRPNADAYLTRFFHSDAIVATGAFPDTNFSRYDRIDRLIEAARTEIDPDRQIHLWAQAQIRILHDMAAFPVIYTKLGFARWDDVDYGHALNSTMALYPQFTEKTRLQKHP